MGCTQSTERKQPPPSSQPAPAAKETMQDVPVEQASVTTVPSASTAKLPTPTAKEEPAKEEAAPAAAPADVAEPTPAVKSAAQPEEAEPEVLTPNTTVHVAAQENQALAAAQQLPIAVAPITVAPLSPAAPTPTKAAAKPVVPAKTRTFGEVASPNIDSNPAHRHDHKSALAHTKGGKRSRRSSIASNQENSTALHNFGGDRAKTPSKAAPVKKLDFQVMKKESPAKRAVGFSQSLPAPVTEKQRKQDRLRRAAGKHYGNVRADVLMDSIAAFERQLTHRSSLNAQLSS